MNIDTEGCQHYTSQRCQYSECGHEFQEEIQVVFPFPMSRHPKILACSKNTIQSSIL